MQFACNLLVKIGNFRSFLGFFVKKRGGSTPPQTTQNNTSQRGDGQGFGGCIRDE